MICGSRGERGGVESGLVIVERVCFRKIVCFGGLWCWGCDWRWYVWFCLCVCVCV